MTVFQYIDPATGETVWEGPAASASEVQAATDRARAAFPGWADRPRQDRIDAVKRYQAVLKERAPQIAEAISRETGKAPVGDPDRAHRHAGQGRHLDPRL